MEGKPSVSKKALAVLGLLLVGANAGKCKNYEQPNCHVYDHSDGSCDVCSFRYWKTSEARCVQVNDQCKDWCKTNGDCTECYQGWVLKKGACVMPGAGDHEQPSCESPVVKPPVVKPPVVKPPVVKPPVEKDHCKKFEYVNKKTNKRNQSWFLGCDKVCAECEDYYYLNAKDECVRLPPHCKVAKTNGECKECKKGYVENAKGDCIKVTEPIDKCLEYEFLDIKGKTFAKWFTGCKVSCKTCEKGLIFNMKTWKCEKVQGNLECESSENQSCEKQSEETSTVGESSSAGEESSVGSAGESSSAGEESSVGSAGESQSCSEPSVQESCEEPSVEAPSVQSCEQPSVEAPSVEAPSVQSCEEPSVEAPSVQSCEEPSVEAPSVQSCEEPSVEAPSVQSCEEPSVEAPSVQSCEEPSVEAPSVQESCEEPSVEAPSVEESCEEPSVEAPSVQESCEEPSVEAPSVEAPSVQSCEGPSVEAPSVQSCEGKPAPARPVEIIHTNSGKGKSSQAKVNKIKVINVEKTKVVGKGIGKKSVEQVNQTVKIQTEELHPEIKQTAQIEIKNKGQGISKNGKGGSEVNLDQIAVTNTGNINLSNVNVEVNTAKAKGGKSGKSGKNPN